METARAFLARGFRVIKMTMGQNPPSDKPGLGIELDEAVLRRYAVAWEVHAQVLPQRMGKMPESQAFSALR